MINKAIKEAKKHLEDLYCGKCNIYEYRPSKDPITKRTVNKEVCVIENQPCRLSSKSISKASEGNVSTVSKVITLFISPEITIKPGSKIVVTQNNVTDTYKNSSKSAIYYNHQEIELELFEGYA